MPIVLNFFYFIGLIILSPILLIRIFFKGKYKDSIKEQLGDITTPSKKKCIWLHGVSVGEIKASQPLVFALEKKFPHCEIIISVTSKAGKETARQMYPQFAVISFPLDFSWVVSKFLRHFDPALVILMELELWPNFLHVCYKRNIPVMLVNGRLSEKSFRGYRRYLGWYFKKMTRAIRFFGVQCSIYAERFKNLGIEADRIHITGNIKFDAIDNNLGNNLNQVRKNLGLEESEKILICGSTHSPEEKMILGEFLKIRQKFPNLRLIIVPRHPQRAEEISSWIRELKFVPICKTKITSNYSADKNDIIIVDTIGELKNLYRICTIAFIGGSLIPHGGQNFIEPASFGKTVLTGPYMQNFPDIRVFLEQNAIIQIKNISELTPKIIELLESSEISENIGNKAKMIVEQSKGSTEKNMELCQSLLA